MHVNTAAQNGGRHCRLDQWRTNGLRRKIHIGIDAETLEVRAVEVTTCNIGDAPMLPELLNQIPPNQDIGSVIADGAYDTRKCHDANATTQLLRGMLVPSPLRSNQWRTRLVPTAQERQTVETHQRRGRCPQRGCQCVAIFGARHQAKMERLPPPKPR